MPLFMCQKCKCFDNTACVDDYWMRRAHGQPILCSECLTGTWHGRFQKQPATGMHIDQDGHLWHTAQLGTLPKNYVIKGVVGG